MKYLLDTNIVSVWARRGSHQLLAHLMQVQPSDLCISSVVEMELLFGIELKPQFGYAAELGKLLGQLPTIGFQSEDAQAAAKIRAALRKSGTPIGPYDALIAAAGLARNLTVVTGNTKEFSRVEGLKLEDWLQAAT